MLQSLPDDVRETWNIYLAKSGKKFGARTTRRLAEATAIFELDTIRQSEAKNAKSLLSRTCEEIYESWREGVYHHQDLRDGEGNLLPEWLNLCYWSFGFHSLGSLTKMLDKAPVPTESTAKLAMEGRHLAAAYHILGAVVAQKLKEAIPGRRPAENTRIDTTERFTCPCCIRQVALQPGWKTMAHHGYSRPFPGMQTGSCAGVRFEPLEQSLDGIIWKIDSLKQNKTNFHNELSKLPNAERLVFETANGIKSFEKDATDDIQWRKLASRKQMELESLIRFVGREIDFFENTLSVWEKVHADKVAEKPRMQ